MEKICIICGQEKDMESFSVMNRNKDGHRAQCKQCIKELARVYYLKNRSNILTHQKGYNQNNKDKKQEYDKIYCDKNKVNRSNYSKQYYQNNKDKEREYDRNRKIKYPILRVVGSLRSRLNKLLRNNSTDKDCMCLDLVGCTQEELRRYLESQFKEGMDWSNYGHNGWHVDHIIPCDYFKPFTPEQQKQCFYYTNLQPLWWYENLSKGAKIVA